MDASHQCYLEETRLYNFVRIAYGGNIIYDLSTKKETNFLLLAKILKETFNIKLTVSRIFQH